jgi:hypothetical protein
MIYSVWLGVCENFFLSLLPRPPPALPLPPAKRPKPSRKKKGGVNHFVDSKSTHFVTLNKIFCPHYLTTSDLKG